MKEYSIETMSTIRPILYPSWPTRLQIFFMLEINAYNSSYSKIHAIYVYLLLHGQQTINSQFAFFTLYDILFFPWQKVQKSLLIDTWQCTLQIFTLRVMLIWYQLFLNILFYWNYYNIRTHHIHMTLLLSQ